MCLNHPELVHKHPAHFVSSITMWIMKVRYGRTTPNSCDKTRHSVMMSFEKVRGGSMCLNHPKLVHREGSVQQNHPELM